MRNFVDAYLAIPPSKLSATWNGGMPLLNRLIWADLNTLPRVLFNKVMTRLLAESYLLQATAEKLHRLNELNSLRSRPINLNNRLLMIASKSVHNAFHHEVMAYATKVKDTSLEKDVADRIAALDHLMTANLIE